MLPNTSGSTKGVSAPNNPADAQRAAVCRLLGGTQTEAAEVAGVTERTIRAWERSSWWGELQRAADALWLDNLIFKSKARLAREVEAGSAGADIAFKVAERTVPALRPPAKDVNVHGVIGLLHRLAALPDDDVERFEDMDDAEVVEAIEALEAA